MDEQTVKEYQSKVQRAWDAWEVWVRSARTATVEERKRLYAEYEEAQRMYVMARQTLAETRRDE